MVPEVAFSRLVVAFKGGDARTQPVDFLRAMFPLLKHNFISLNNARNKSRYVYERTHMGK